MSETQRSRRYTETDYGGLTNVAILVVPLMCHFELPELRSDNISAEQCSGGVIRVRPHARMQGSRPAV